MRSNGAPTIDMPEAIRENRSTAEYSPKARRAPASIQAVSYKYDEAGRRIRETNGEGEATRYTYDLQGHVSLRRSSGNNDTRYTYDAHGNKKRKMTLSVDEFPRRSILHTLSARFRPHPVFWVPGRPAPF